MTEDLFAKIRIAPNRPPRTPNMRLQRPVCGHLTTGYVYVMESPVEAKIKVGWTRDPGIRAIKLSRIGRPVCRRWEGECGKKGATKLEAAFHRRFKKGATSLGKEWYSIPVHEAVKTIRSIAAELGVTLKESGFFNEAGHMRLEEKSAIGVIRSFDMRGVLQFPHRRACARR